MSRYIVQFSPADTHASIFHRLRSVDAPVARSDVSGLSQGADPVDDAETDAQPGETGETT